MQWGIVDVADCCNAAKYLAEQVKREKGFGPLLCVSLWSRQAPTARLSHASTRGWWMTSGCASRAAAPAVTRPWPASRSGSHADC